MKYKKILAIIICVILASQSMIVIAADSDTDDYLNSVMDMVMERYYQDVSRDELMSGALEGILDTMDDYTTFFDMNESESFIGSMEGNYEGIGVTILEVPEGVIITKVFQESPAELAGVLSGDKIVLVEGQSIAGYTAEETSALIKGEVGTKVELGIKREGVKDIITIPVVRSSIDLNPVSYRIDGDMGYIKIDSFNMNSSSYFEDALLDMDNNGIHKIIIDLRNNLGGEVSQAVSIARDLVSKGLITKLDFKSNKSVDVSYYSYNDEPKYVSALLVNGNSASASEILAGAVQDSEDGFLVGTKTFGKGVFQNLFPVLSPDAYEKYKKKFGEGIVNAYDLMNRFGDYPLPNEIIGYTKITTGHYLTRNGRMIHGVGLEPDVEVENYEMENGIDVNGIESLTEKNSLYLGSESMDIYNAEKILTIAGYDIDKPDTILDSKTSLAIRKFQSDEGIQADGIIGNRTRQQLNLELEKQRLSIDKQYAKAVELLGLFN